MKLGVATGSRHLLGERLGLAMGLTYFKRYRMEIALSRAPAPGDVPPEYTLFPWHPDLLEAHADAKYYSFREEIDASVFPCLGDDDGCLRLMREISRKPGFLPGATWLACYEPQDGSPVEPCGTVQGIRDGAGLGAIQNLGVTPAHRGRGLGACLLLRALAGFREAGIARGFLEVTAQNKSAIRLYRRLGFRTARTVYKAIELSAVAAS